MHSRRYSAPSVPQLSDPQTGVQSNSSQSETLDIVATRRNPRNSVPSQPPRYSNLSPLASDVAEHGSEVNNGADAIDDRMSFMSLESNATTPTYMTLVPAGHSNDTRSAFRASTATITNPPRYSSMSHRYSAAAPKEFEFTVRGGGLGLKGQPWATLKLYNAEARGGKGGNYPKFYEGENIFGRVELSLLGPHTIKNVKLVLKGTMITSAMDTGSVNFLEQTYTVWDRSFGDPRQPQPEQKFDGKLEGDYVFPFSIPFPKYVKLSTLEAIQANGQPVESQIQLSPQGAGLGGRITAFPTESPLQKNLADYDDESAMGEASSNSDIAHSHVNSSSTLEVPLAARTEHGLGQSYITPLHTDSSSSLSSAFSSPAPGLEPGPSAISPYTYSREDQPPSTSKETSRKGSRWSFSKSAFTSANDSQKKQRGNKASSSTAEEPEFGGNPPFQPLPLDYRAATNQIPELKSEIPVVLPQSFLERDVKANTKYELTLLISHGRFSSSSKVKTTIVYNRTTVPPPMPWLRRDAYQERQALPCPTVDHEVWHQLPTVSMRGTFLQQRKLKVDYALALANPVSYARGTVIPCYLTIACDDISALNLFSNPRSPRVCLSRAVRYLDSGGGSEGALSLGAGTSYVGAAPYKLTVLPQVSAGISIQHQKKKTGSGDHRFNGGKGLAVGLDVHGTGDLEHDVPQDDGTPVSNAVWWISQEFDEEGAVGEEGVRTLQGEIHLPSDLQPSCPFPLFNISYRVELLAPVSRAFEPELDTMDKRASGSSQKGRVYASQFVEITTDSRNDEPDVIAFTKLPSRSAVSRPRPTDIMGSLLSESGFL